jgi:hypothetical protein
MQEIVSVDRQKAHIGFGPVSPAGAASRGRPPKNPAAPTVQPCNFMKICELYVEKSTSYLDLNVPVLIENKITYALDFVV